MKKVGFFLFFVLLSTFSIAQGRYDRTFYLSANVGYGIPLHNTPTIKSNKLDYDYSFFDKASAYIKVKDRWGVHVNFLGIGYWSDMQVSPPQNFDLLTGDLLYGNVKWSLLVGGAYKFGWQGITIISFVDVGYIPHANSSIEKSYLLKEKNSNNIMSANNTLSTAYSKFDYAFGVDIFCHLTKYFGVSAHLQFDRFKGTSTIYTQYEDYYGSYPPESATVKFRYINILASLGLFVAF